MADVIPDPQFVEAIAEWALKDAARRNPVEAVERALADYGSPKIGTDEYVSVRYAAVVKFTTARLDVSWPAEQSTAEPDLSGWSAAENAEFEKMYGIQAAMRLRAANNRVWAIVQELRNEAVKAGRDPYQDPMAQRLSAALVGVDNA